MKTIKLLAAIVFMAGSISAFAQKENVNTVKTTVVWTGEKVGGSHTGNISVKSGYLELKDGNITGGKIVMDMNSITNTDLEDAEYNAKLVGHLKSDDFFGVATYPTATFVVSSATKFSNGKASVTGKITIKGKTETISFDVEKKGSTYIGQMNVDRSKFDVKYGSGSFFDDLGDKVIYDIFILDISLVL